MIAPDLPGHGLNASFPESWWSRAQDPGKFAGERSPLAQLTLTDLGAAMTAVVQQVLGPERQIILVGHGMADLLLNWTGEAVPELVSRLAYLSARWRLRQSPACSTKVQQPQHTAADPA